MKRQRSRIPAVLGIASVAVLAWIVLRAGTVARPHAPESRSESSLHSADAHAELSAPGAAVEDEPDRRSSGASTTTEANAPPLAELAGRFVDADGEALELERVVLELAPETGSARYLELEHAQRFRCASLEPAKYVVTAASPGFAAEPVNVDLRGGGEHEVDIVMSWKDQLRIHARAADGRTYRVLAEELELTPRTLFSGGFRAYVSVERPSSESMPPIEALARRFRQVGYPASERTDDDHVGLLRVEHGLPCFVGLAFHGAFLGWVSADVGARDVEFRIDVHALQSQLAQLRVRVLEAGSERPLTSARASLMPETSDLRRTATSDAKPDAHGDTVIAPVIPGDYDLRISDDELEASHYARLHFEPGQTVDLGVVSLARAPAIEVDVVMPDGRAASAYVEIGPFRAGARPDEVLGPHGAGMGRDGRIRMRVPASSTVIRARFLEAPRLRSVCVLVDPAALPSEPIRLVIHSSKDVDVALGGHARTSSRFRLFDEIGLLLQELGLSAADSARVDVVPGRYRAQVVDSTDTVLVERSFDVDEHTTRVVL